MAARGWDVNQTEAYFVNKVKDDKDKDGKGKDDMHDTKNTDDKGEEGPPLRTAAAPLVVWTLHPFG